MYLVCGMEEGRLAKWSRYCSARLQAGWWKEAVAMEALPAAAFYGQASGSARLNYLSLPSCQALTC